MYGAYCIFNLCQAHMHIQNIDIIRYRAVVMLCPMPLEMLHKLWS